MDSDNRLYSLDYLRGLAAFAIMLYHYLGWSYGSFDAASVMGRIGVYGVSIFYVLSGLTLYHVYFDKFKPNAAGLKDFFMKRLFRIFPLLWLVMGFTLFTTKGQLDFYEIFLNLTGLFSVLAWEDYIGVGVWSIGNELVFYLFFPLFIILSRHKPLLFYGLCTALLGLYLYFAFFVLNEAQQIRQQWADYVNPLNQVFLFLGGYLIGFWTTRWNFSPMRAHALWVGAIVAFVLYPVSGNAIELVTDASRLVFTLLCFTICFAVYKADFKLPALVHHSLKQLGEISYSIYLLHPLVWFGIKALATSLVPQIGIIDELYLLVAAVPITLLLSHQVYHRYELFFMQAGKKITARAAVPVTAV